jgi:hypothetical protein
MNDALLLCVCGRLMNLAYCETAFGSCYFLLRYTVLGCILIIDDYL